MKLTSKARYAVMAVADLALYSILERNTVVLKEIAQRQDISISYLEQLFAKLRKKKIVNSLRGPGGGYYLAKNMDEISVWDIITAVDETIELKRCTGNGDCIHGDKCITHNLWNELTKTISAYLKQATIGTILRDHLSDDKANSEVLERLRYYKVEQKLRRNAGLPKMRLREELIIGDRINIMNIDDDHYDY
ncbi:Rrf2 family transcriptional regulator [Psittacicella hinzii]|uniref:Rrf2 family transcriptional regulator n=1 Tax=Psittacicella hinzii TaxID=2028575 RepID=UPI003624408A